MNMDKVMKACPLCDGTEEYGDKYGNGYTMMLSEEDNELNLVHYDDWCADFTINYCPICGRKLNQ